MRNNHGFTLIELGVAVCVIGVLASIGITNLVSMQDRAKDAKTKSNAHVLQLAVEDYAVRHDGSYTVAAADIVPMLPNTALLENSYTNVRTEPRFGSVAAAIGELGIIAIMEGGQCTGYSITGWGKEAPILTLTNGN